MWTPFKNDYGFCWGVETIFENLMVGHSGGAPGVSAVFRRYLNDRYTLIVLSNYSGAASPVANTIEAILFGQEYQLPRKNLSEFLYQIVEEKGISYLEENFADILADNDYVIRSANMLNMLGYTFLQEQMNEAAIVVFRFNIHLFPDQANPYDSLAEAYMISGDLQKSREYYNKALEVDPNFDNAKKMLERLDLMEKTK
jgi:tetratricopeptide (TPR) repeat protein